MAQRRRSQARGHRGVAVTIWMPKARYRRLRAKARSLSTTLTRWLTNLSDQLDRSEVEPAAAVLPETGERVALAITRSKP